MLPLLLAAFLSSENILAMPMTDEFLNDPTVRAFLADVLRQGGYGHWQTERAAFLVRDEHDAYRCIAWPLDGNLHQQHFAGTIPERTVAIAHTHPKDLPSASFGDRQTAMALSVPIFVLTPLNIELVKPDGATVTVVSNKWWANASSSRRCSAPDSRASR